METMVVENDLLHAPWKEIQGLLSECYPKPPSDVFEKVISLSHTNLRLWIALSSNDNLIGLIMLSPHGKGGHIENISVSKESRNNGIGRMLLKRVIDDVSKDGNYLITLTTRKTKFFENFGFTAIANLGDGSTAMSLVIDPDDIHQPQKLR